MKSLLLFLDILTTCAATLLLIYLFWSVSFLLAQANHWQLPQ